MLFEFFLSKTDAATGCMTAIDTDQLNKPATNARAVNFQIDLRGGQWKTIWFTSGGQFESLLPVQRKSLKSCNHESFFFFFVI